MWSVLYWKTYRFIFNFLGSVAKFLGLFDFICNLLWPLDEQSIMKKAQEITKYSDFGEHFEKNCRKPHQLLLQSWKQDKNVTLFGRSLVYYNYVDTLSSILQVNKVFNEISQVKNVKIKEPIFIIGWPRTGSTILHNLFAQDIHLKAPVLWELLSPCPPPHPDTRQADKRIKDTHVGMSMWFDLEPELKKIHYMNAEKPDECCHPFEQTFIDRHSPIKGQNTTEYTKWLFSLSTEQMTEYYQQYKKILQILALNHSPSRRYVLKDSTHMMFISSLLQVFPDAKIVITHRAPLEVVGSCCSGFYIISHFYYEYRNIDKQRLGQRVLMYLNECVKRMREIRNNISNEKEIFFDMRYKEFMKNPVETVKEIYQHFHMDFTPELQTTMTQFMEENKKDKHGRHNYSLEPFNITRTQLNDLFGDYCTYYGVH